MRIKTLQMLVAAVALTCAGTASAEKASVVVAATDGTSTRIELCDGMTGSYTLEENVIWFKITEGQFIYQDGQFVPDESSDNPGVVHFSTPVTKINGLTFHGVNTAVGEINADNGLTVDLEGRRLVFRKVTAPVQLTVTSADGKAEANRMITEDTEIDLSAYGSGVHLVKAGERTFKILVK